MVNLVGLTTTGETDGALRRVLMGARVWTWLLKGTAIHPRFQNVALSGPLTVTVCCTVEFARGIPMLLDCMLIGMPGAKNAIYL
jgi:hypothetical protein